MNIHYKRAEAMTAVIMRESYEQWLGITPLGRFDKTILDYLEKQEIIKQVKDTIFYNFHPKDGRGKWKLLKNKVASMYHNESNKQYQGQRMFIENIDIILTLKNAKYSFVPKNHPMVADMRDMCDAFEWTDNDKLNLKQYERWEIALETENEELKKETA